MAEQQEILLGNAFVSDKGTWVNGTKYEANDIVHTEDGVYLSLVDDNATEPKAGEAWRAWLNKQAIIDNLSEHPQRVGDNGNWEKWDIAQQKYVDTQIAARGGIFYPSFETDGNELYIDDNNSQVADRLVLDGNELSLIL